MSRMMSIVLLTGLGFIVGPIVVQGQNSHSSPERGATSLVCTMSAFFSADTGTPVEAANQTASIHRKLQFEGRGLVSCKNDQGFATEVPVLADLEATLPESESLERGIEIALSGNTSPFVITKEINQIHDQYESRQYSWLHSSPTTNPTVLFRGTNNDLVFEMKMTSNVAAMKSLKIQGVTLHFDDAAPDFR